MEQLLSNISATIAVGGAPAAAASERGDGALTANDSFARSEVTASCRRMNGVASPRSSSSSSSFSPSVTARHAVPSVSASALRPATVALIGAASLVLLTSSPSPLAPPTQHGARGGEGASSEDVKLSSDRFAFPSFVRFASAFPFGGGFGGGRGPNMGPPPPNYEGKDFYKTLGVTKKATDEQIRRQYRRLARQYHPDVRSAAVEKEKEKAKASGTTANAKANAQQQTNKKKKNEKKEPPSPAAMSDDEAREHFQAINEAYNILSDASKRAEYDEQKANEAAYGKGGGMGGMGPGGMGGMGGGMGGFPSFGGGGGFPFGGMGGMGGGMPPPFGGGMGGGNARGKGPAGSGPNKGSNGLSEDQMRQAYEMFMANFAGGANNKQKKTAQKGGGAAKKPSSSSSGTASGARKTRAGSANSGAGKKKPAARSSSGSSQQKKEASEDNNPSYDTDYNPYGADPTPTASANVDTKKKEEEDGEGWGWGGGSKSDEDINDAFASRYEGYSEGDAAYARDGGRGSGRNMYRDWARRKEAQRAREEEEAEEAAYFAAQRSSGGGAGGGGSPPTPPRHFRERYRKRQHSKAYDGSSADGDGRADFEGGGGGGGGGGRDAFRNAGFRDAYEAYNMFANGPSAAGGGGGGFGAPEGASAFFSSLFGSVGADEAREEERRRRAEASGDDPFASYAAAGSSGGNGGVGDADTAEADRYAEHFRQYEAFKKRRQQQQSSENDDTDAASSSSSSFPSSRDRDREEFMKQYKAFEEHQRQMEETAANARAAARAEKRRTARKATFDMGNMFGGAADADGDNGDASPSTSSSWGGGASSASYGATAAESEATPTEAAEEAAEDYTEDIYGNRRPRRSRAERAKERAGAKASKAKANTANKKAKKGSTAGGGGSGKAAADPLEEAYLQEEEGGTDANGYHNEEGSSSTSRSHTNKKKNNNGGASSPFADGEEFMDSFRRFGQHPNTAHDEAYANSPSTQTFADLARGWAASMARKYAGGGTVPKGPNGEEAVPDQSVDPEASGKDHFAARGSRGAHQRANVRGRKRQQQQQQNANAKKSSDSVDTANTDAKKRAGSGTRQANAQKRKKARESAWRDDDESGDPHARPSDEEMEELKGIFNTDNPPDHASMPSSPPPRDDPWWQTAFKDGKGPPAAGVRDVPRVPGKLNGPAPKSKGRVAPKGGDPKPASSASTGTATKGKKTAESGKQQGEKEAADKKKSEAAADTQKGGAVLTVEEDFGFTKSGWDTYCGASDSSTSTASSGREPTCVVFFSSGTSMKGMNSTIGAVAKRFPLTARTFFVTRPNAVKVSDFIFEHVRSAHTPSTSSSAAGTESDVDASNANEDSIVPLAFKEALCGASYAKATIANAGELCAVVARRGGRDIAVVGNQRTRHLDLPDSVRTALAANDEAIAALRREKGLAASKKGIAGAKDAEAMVYLALKRGLLSFIDFAALL